MNENDPGMHWPAPRDVIELFQAGANRKVWPFRTPAMDIGPEAVSLNIGAGRKSVGRSYELDYPEWDAETMDLPWGDSKVSVIYALHLFEHLTPEGVIRTLRECQRVLVSRGALNVVVPHRLSQGAYHDLDHKTFWCEETWRNLFHNPYSDKAGMRSGWEFEIGINLMIGLNERNLMLVTQLIRQ
jgi:hypothetical protein